MTDHMIDTPLELKDIYEIEALHNKGWRFVQPPMGTEHDDTSHVLIRWYRAHGLELLRMAKRCIDLEGKIKTPELEDFATGVVLEAQHQRARWPDGHDENKSPPDWFWTLGYLAQKAMTSQMAGDSEKAKHHLITSAALMANWHALLPPTEGPHG